MRRILPLAASALLALALVGCESSDQQVANKAPETLGPAETVTASAQHLRRGDIAALIKGAVPADRYETLRGEWSKRTQEDPSSEADRKEFADTMAKLTAADAESVLLSELEPQLAKAEAEMGPQLPLMVGMGRGFAVQALMESKELDDAQKQQATAMIDALVVWVQGAKFFDREHAKAAIGHVVSTARGLELTSLEQVEALDFDAAMAKAGQVYLGMSKTLAVYGLDLDATLASVKAEVVEQQDDLAKVKVSYSLFNQPLSFETRMVRRNDRWFGEDALKELEKQLAPEAPVAEGEPAVDGDLEAPNVDADVEPGQ